MLGVVGFAAGADLADSLDVDGAFGGFEALESEELDDESEELDDESELVEVVSVPPLSAGSLALGPPDSSLDPSDVARVDEARLSFL